MSVIENIVRLKEILPETFIKSIEFVNDPAIRAENNEYNNALKYFVSSALMVGGIIAVLKSALPNAFAFDAVAGINPFVLTIILLANGICYSLIFYAAAWVVLLPTDGIKPRSYYGYHSLRLFAVLNVVITVLMMIGINRISVNQSSTKAVDDFDLWLGGGLSFLVFWLMYRCLVKPIAHQFSMFYRRGMAWSLAIIVFSVSSYFNPALNVPYYNNLIDSGKLCETMIENKYFDDIVNGRVNYHQKLFECKVKFKNL